MAAVQNSMICKAGRAACMMGAGCPITRPVTASKRGVKATRPVTAVQRNATRSTNRRSAWNESPSLTSAMAVASSMMTGLSTSSASDIVRPQAARLSAGSGRRPIAPCTAGPSSIINSKLTARGSHSAQTVRRRIVPFPRRGVCPSYDTSSPDARRRLCHERYRIMPTPTEADWPALDDMEAQVAFYRANSYVPLPGLLTPEQVDALNAAMDEDRERHRFMWYCTGSPDYNCNLLLTQPVFEIAIRQPHALALVARLMGGPICFEELAVRQNPASKEAHPTGWHRDRGHWLEHPLHLDYPQIIYYLTDVDETTHCFTISPEPADGEALETE